jgi:hypothetical protein
MLRIDSAALRADAFLVFKFIATSTRPRDFRTQGNAPARHADRIRTRHKPPKTYAFFSETLAPRNDATSLSMMKLPRLIVSNLK